MTQKYKPKDPFSNKQLFTKDSGNEFKGLLWGFTCLVLLYVFICAMGSI